MPLIANVQLGNTFNEWRVRTNLTIDFINELSNTAIGTPNGRILTFEANNATVNNNITVGNNLTVSNNATVDTLTFTTNTQVTIPRGNTAQRGTAEFGAFRYNVEENTFEGYGVDGWGEIGGGGLGLFKLISANYSANVGDRLAVDTTQSNSNIVVTLPPVVDSETIIEFADKEANFANNNLIIDRNGHTIEGQTANLVADVSSSNFFLQYTGSTFQVFGTGSGLSYGVESVNGYDGIVNLTTDDVPEGSNNLYYTTSRVTTDAPVSSVAGKTGNVTVEAVDVDMTQVDKGTITSNTIFDVSQAEKQKATIGGSLTVSLTGWPASGEYEELEIELVNGGSATITWPTTNWAIGDGTYSTTFADMGITLQSSGTNYILFWSSDGGTTLYGIAI